MIYNPLYSWKYTYGCKSSYDWNWTLKYFFSDNMFGWIITTALRPSQLGSWSHFLNQKTVIIGLGFGEIRYKRSSCWEYAGERWQLRLYRNPKWTNKLEIWESREKNMLYHFFWHVSGALSNRFEMEDSAEAGTATEVMGHGIGMKPPTILTAKKLPYQIHFWVTPKKWKRDSSWYMFVRFYVSIFVWLQKSELFQSIVCTW